MKEVYKTFAERSLQERKTELSAFKAARTDSVPIILRTDEGLPELETCKFAGLKDTPMTNLLRVVRKTMPDLGDHEALFLLVESESGPVMITGSTTFGQAWAAYDSEDGFLHAVVCKENVFGGIHF